MTAYLARTLTKTGFGTLEFARSFIIYFTLIINLGLDTFGMREIARERERIAFFVGNILNIRIIVGVLTLLVYVLIVLILNKPFEQKLVLLIMGSLLLANIFLLNFAYKGLERMGLVALRTFLTSAVSFAGVYILVKKPDQLLLAALIIGVSQVVNSMWLLGYYIKEYGWFSLKVDAKIWRDFLRASIPMAASLFMIAVYYNMDIVMLGFLKDESHVAVYAAAYKILTLAILPATLILHAFFPQMSAAADSREKKIAIMNMFSKTMFVVGFPISMFGLIYAPEIITLVYGETFSGSVLPLRMLMVNVIMIYINVTLGNPLLAWDRQTSYLKAISVGGVGNAFLNVLLIPKFGIIGAASATLSGELLVMIGLIILHYKETRTIYIKNLLTAFSLMLGFACALVLLKNVANLLLILLAAGGIYLLFLYLFGYLKMNDTLRLIQGSLTRIS